MKANIEDSKHFILSVNIWVPVTALLIININTFAIQDLWIMTLKRHIRHALYGPHMFKDTNSAVSLAGVWA